MDNKSVKLVPLKASSGKAPPAPAVAATPKPAIRPFASKVRTRPKVDLFTKLRNSAGFTIALGLLFTALGLMSFIPFHNQFSKLMLDLGLVITLFGFFMKLLDIIFKIAVDR